MMNVTLGINCPLNFCVDFFFYFFLFFFFLTKRPPNANLNTTTESNYVVPDEE